jgi:hypothetical protein
MNAVTTTDFDTLTQTAEIEREVAAVTHPPQARLHPGVLGVAVGAYALMVATFWLGFMASEPTFGISMVIVAVCFVGYFGLPLAMYWNATRFQRRHQQAEPPYGTFRHFLQSGIETQSGRVSGFGALALVTTVPLCLSAGAIAFTIIRHVV